MAGLARADAPYFPGTGRFTDVFQRPAREWVTRRPLAVGLEGDGPQDLQHVQHGPDLLADLLDLLRTPFSGRLVEGQIDPGNDGVDQPGEIDRAGGRQRAIGGQRAAADAGGAAEAAAPCAPGNREHRHVLRQARVGQDLRVHAPRLRHA